MRRIAPQPGALTPGAFAEQLNLLGPPRRLALAVSGGRDSIALLRLCAEHARQTGRGLAAFTIDHGLRAEAAREAERAARWAGEAGVEHTTLRWEGDKPASGVQAAARQARYRLLIEAAQAAGCDGLATAHTLDDQAETLFMRLSRGAGPTGLAAIRAESIVASGAGAPIRLLRPLLGFSRRAVTEWLGDIGQDYVDDPSNDDPSFERVRVRAVIAALAEQDLLTPEALAEAARKSANAADAMLAQQDELFRNLGGCFYGWGGVALDRWRAEAPGAAGLARRLIHAAGAGEFPPDEAGAMDAVAKAVAMGAGTLGGALVKSWRGRLWFLREPAALLGRAGRPPLAPAALEGDLLWDRRFAISAPQAEHVEIAPLGAAAKADLGAKAGLFNGPDEALATLPGLYHRGVLIGAAGLPFMQSGASAGPVRARSLVQERFLGRIVRFS